MVVDLLDFESSVAGCLGFNCETGLCARGGAQRVDMTRCCDPFPKRECMVTS